MLPIME